MKYRVIQEGPGEINHEIRPDDIDLKNFISKFGKAEVEKSAANLVSFCQARGGWYPFTIQELENFCKKSEFDPRFMFFGLLGPWEDDSMTMIFSPQDRFHDSYPCLVACCDGMYRITNVFIEMCAKKNFQAA